MVRPIAKIAAILAVIAVPVEWFNYRYLAFPIDVGYENPTWFQQVTGTEWVLLHFPGLRLLGPLESHGLRQFECASAGNQRLPRYFPDRVPGHPSVSMDRAPQEASRDRLKLQIVVQSRITLPHSPPIMASKPFS